VSARTHPRLVGAFVLGGVALVLGAVLLLSGRDWFERRERFSVYFPGSLRGLNRGAAVTFRGIKVGEVAEVTALATGQASPPIQIEVVIELVGNVIEAPPGLAPPFSALSGPDLAKEFVARGFRGRLMSQSLLTGQKYIDLDFLPQEPARFAGLSRRYPELPTASTSIERLGQKGEELVDKIAALPADEMLEDLREALRSLRTLLESPDLKGAIGGTRRSMEALRPALEDARQTLAEMRRLSASLDTEVKDTAGEAAETARKLRQTLDRAERSLAQLDHLASGTDEARMQASRSLEDLSRTLASLRELAEYLQRHPEALVQGKPGRKGE
jgi:paraquat-inducible protein B